MDVIQEFAKLLAIICCGLFAGAAIYINLVEHPARMECGTEIAVKEFGPSYRRAAMLQAPLAAAGFAGSIVAWLNGAGLWWLTGGVLLASVIPLTLLVIAPINKQLLAPALDRDSIQTVVLLSRWNRLHAVRSILSGVAWLIFLLNH